MNDMVDRAYLKSIGLSEDQSGLLLEALDREKRLRVILLQEGISPKIAESILRVTDSEKIDFGNEDLLREKIRVEWADFIKNSMVL